MEEVKTFQVTDDNGYIGFARDNGHYQKEKSDIADAFHKLEVSIDLGSFYMDTANILRSLLKNYVGLLNATHDMIEVETDGQQDDGLSR